MKNNNSSRNEWFIFCSLGRLMQKKQITTMEMMIAENSQSRKLRLSLQTCAFFKSALEKLSSLPRERFLVLTLNLWSSSKRQLKASNLCFSWIKFIIFQGEENLLSQIVYPCKVHFSLCSSDSKETLLSWQL